MSQGPQSHGVVIALSVISTSITLSFVALRVYARRIKGVHFAANDYLILASAGFFVICITVPTIICKYGDLIERYPSIFKRTTNGKLRIVAANSHLGDHMVLTPSGIPTPPTYAFNLVYTLSNMSHAIIDHLFIAP